MGGLDGIIAGALAKAKTSGQQGGEKMKDLLSSLQDSATGATADAHETLISVLGHTSVYRDTALIRLEQVFSLLDIGARYGCYARFPDSGALSYSQIRNTPLILEQCKYTTIIVYI